MLRLAPGPSWTTAVRAAVAMTGPFAFGAATGDVRAGMAAGLGGFTALYARDRPYADRALILAWIAVALSAAIGLGVWTAHAAAVSVLLVAVIAAAIAIACLVLRTGPPGAYMFAFAFAAGVGSRSHADPLTLGLLVLAGGGFAWLVAMEGVVHDPRGPERTAVDGAARAVEVVVRSGALAASGHAGRQAGDALRRAWTTLYTRQPFAPRPGGELERQQERLRVLQRRFVEVILECEHPAESTDPAERGFVDGLPAANGPATERTTTIATPGRVFGLLARGRESGTLRVGLRVLVATLVAGILGRLLGLAHAYWTVAAAMLVVYRGVSRRETIEKGLERALGTIVGVALTFGVLVLHPAGWWFVGVFFLTVCIVDFLVVRNYVLAAVFITVAALLLATSAPGADAAGIALARGLDTLIGCAVGTLTVLAVNPRGLRVSPRSEVAATLTDIADVLATLSAPTAEPRFRARSRLRRRLTTLDTLLDLELNDVSAQPAPRREQIAIAVTQQAAQHVLAESWAVDTGGSELGSPASPPARSESAFRDLARDLATRPCEQDATGHEASRAVNVELARALRAMDDDAVRPHRAAGCE